ncbi:hypothetical protein Sros01_74180 [Streptomyces roseochromogenus]|nr:hypothetical protein Sros01_74180 [Streptomyces roseochromogenus]
MGEGARYSVASALAGVRGAGPGFQDHPNAPLARIWVTPLGLSTPRPRDDYNAEMVRPLTPAPACPRVPEARTVPEVRVLREVLALPPGERYRSAD